MPQGTSKWSANFHLKRSKVKVTGRQKSRPNPLLGLIYCQCLRRLVTGWTAAYHVFSCFCNICYSVHGCT